MKYLVISKLIYMDIKRILELNDSEIKIIKLLKKKSYTSEQLSSVLNKDISTVNRYLNDLLRKRLIYKISKCCTPQRGRYFVYFLNSNREINNFVDKRLEEIKKEIFKFLETISN